MNLIISDFDGTLFDKNYKENIKAIKKIKNTDLVVATGRNYDSLKKDLKIDCKYYICNDGGYILDENKNIIYKNYFNQKSIKKIYKEVKNLNYNDYFFDYIDTFSNKLLHNVNKLSIKIRDNKAKNDMNYILSNIKDAYGYLSENWINILPIFSTKEKAINYILNNNCYDKIYVVGNECNDYKMIKKYNGFLITNTPKNGYNCVNNFLEVINKLKKEK